MKAFLFRWHFQSNSCRGCRACYCVLEVALLLYSIFANLLCYRTKLGAVSTKTAVPDTQHSDTALKPKVTSSVLFTYHQVTSHNNENVDTNNCFRSINHKQQIKLETLIIIFRSRLILLKHKAKKNWLKAIFWLFINCLDAGIVEDEVSSSLSSSLPCWGKNCRSKLPWLFFLSGMLMCDMPSGTPLHLY